MAKGLSAGKASSRDNQAVTGEIFCVAAGRVSRLVFANNDGFHHPALNAELVAANIGSIRDTSRYSVVTSGQDEMARYFHYHPMNPTDGTGAATAAEIERDS